MSALLEIVLVLFLILVNGLFAMAELSLISARRTRLAMLERKRVAGARTARNLAENPQSFLPTVQIGVTLVGILAGTIGGGSLAAHLTPLLTRAPLIGQAAGGVALSLTVLAITFLTLVLGELVPKQLALRAPEAVATSLARPIRLLSVLVAPLVWLLGRASDLVLRALGRADRTRQAVTEEELRALLAEGAAAGVLETEERDMIERVLRLADKPVRAIMTPRNELAWIDRTDPRREIVAALQAAPHSRFVVGDGSVDNVVGVVQAKDLLDRMLDGNDLSVGAVLRQPMVVPDTVTALDALERLKADSLGLALVIDEYGSLEGVVTAADVLQAIVGDATDPALPAQDFHEVPEKGPLLLEGAMPVDELKIRLHLPDLPAEGSYHTLGGLLLALLRRVPVAGDRIVFGGWLFEVQDMDGRRVDHVLARRETLAEA